MISDNTKEFIKEHAQTQGKTLYKIENLHTKFAHLKIFS